ncbi:MAG: YHS domain-containing protein [Bacillota bacterium]
MAKDPVCGMNVDESTAKAKSEYQGQTYYFCAPGCKAAFDKNPEQYLGSTGGGMGPGHGMGGLHNQGHHGGGCGCH